MQHRSPLRLLALSSAVFLAACGGDDDVAATPAPPAAEETRAQDSRTFTAADATATTFDALANGSTTTDATWRWAGMLNGAAYHIEVPSAGWNGKLVMYAHGYAGMGNELEVADPSIRRHLIEQGYAWAASSYAKNYYDVRAGIEDTNALALAFTRIAAANGRTLAAPTKTFIIGHSMGGHIAAAAVEDETYATANNKVKYNGAVPMCGVTGDTELFDYFAAAQITAQALAGLPKYPTVNWSDISATVNGKLFTTFSTSPATPHAFTADGLKWASVMQNLTGGPRPMFDLGVVGPYTSVVWSLFGADGTVNGIFNKNALDTNRFTYTINGDTAGSSVLNTDALKLTAATDFNRLRRDGLRWVPKVNGDVKVPVVTIHTLGDMFVPFSMEQIYRQRVEAKGNSAWLVQRAIRGIAHCDFTIQEQVEAFDAMTAWEAGGPKPAGDDVLTPATVAAASYGCTFTRNTLGTDESDDTRALRPTAAGLRPCP